LVGSQICEMVRLRRIKVEGSSRKLMPSQSRPRPS
jgi:hypothetical protein